MVEMMVALVVIAIVASASVLFFVNNIRSINNQRQHQEAVYLANQQIETVQALPISKLVKGRTQADVQAQFASAAARAMSLSSQDDVSNAANYDSSASTSGAEVVAYTNIPVVNKVPYTVQTFVGVCWYAATIGVCGPTSTSSTNKEYRVSIYETWSSPGPCQNSCEYTTSTLIDPTADPTFNSNISAPTGTLTTPSSGTVYTDNTYSDTCTTNAGNSVGTTIKITNGTNMKSGIGVRISNGGGTAVKVAQPSSTEVDFCLITADAPGTYTITVINTDGGHFQVPITELPDITGAAGWTPSAKTLTLYGGGFETGSGTLKDDAGNSFSYQVYQCSTAPFYSSQAPCGGVAGPDQLAVANFTGPTNGATKTLTLTNPDSSSATWTITAPTATGFFSIPQGKAYWVLGQTTSLTVTGFGFTSATGVISGNNGSFAATNLSSTTEKLVLSGGTAGTETAQLYNPDGGTTVSGAVPIDAAPTVTTATPNSVKASKSGTTSTYTTVALVGTNFVSGMTATATNGASITAVTYTNATHLSITLNAPTTKTTTITLTNPVDGANVSFAIAVTPTITASAPSSITHNTTTTFTITGTGFASGASVALTEAGGGLTETNITVSSATQITFKAKTNNTNKSGSTTLTITVTNADGSVSNTFSSTVSVS